MKLSYRGTQYTRQPAKVTILETHEIGHYRGQDFRFHAAKVEGATQSTPNGTLKYRGAVVR